MLITKYHVFTDGLDDWFEDLEEAIIHYGRWCEVYESVRLYKEIYDDESGEDVEEDCLIGQGDYPC